jgi:DNA-binding winged helix-turn-helix (wHTH) protein/TolB-like protein
MAYRFGAFRYDPAQRLLFRGEERVPLLPKVADTLHVLMERRGQVVEKAELMRLVWPDTTVEEIGLNRNISLLRKALEDDDPSSPIIETIPRRGYRFAATLAESVPPQHAANVPQPRLRRSLVLVGLAALLVLAGIYYQFYVPSRLLPAGQTAIAVIPFSCLCPGMDGEAFAQSLNELLVTRLAQLPAVHVVAPSTVRRHQRVGVSTGFMGRLLGLDALVEGAIQKQEEVFITTVRLVDVHTGKVIWADTIRHSHSAASPVADQTATALSERLRLPPKH